MRNNFKAGDFRYWGQAKCSKEIDHVFDLVAAVMPREHAMQLAPQWEDSGHGSEVDFTGYGRWSGYGWPGRMPRQDGWLPRLIWDILEQPPPIKEKYSRAMEPDKDRVKEVTYQYYTAQAASKLTLKHSKWQDEQRGPGGSNVHVPSWGWGTCAAVPTWCERSCFSKCKKGDGPCQKKAACKSRCPPGEYGNPVRKDSGGCLVVNNKLTLKAKYDEKGYPGVRGPPPPGGGMGKRVEVRNHAYLIKMLNCPLDPTGGDKEQCRVEKYCIPGAVEFILPRGRGKTQDKRKLYAAAIVGEERPSSLEKIRFDYTRRTYYEFINDEINRINSKELTKAPCTYF